MTSRLFLGPTTTTRRDAASTVDVNYFDRTQPTTSASGNLPHLFQDGVVYFVTFRLADSLPASRLEALLAERDAWLANHPKPHQGAVRNEYYVRFVDRLERWLDAGAGECILKNPAIRDIVVKAFHHFAGERYYLGPYVVMPNHVHILLSPVGRHSLSQVMHSWKSFTAKRINQLLGRKGTVWQKESFDHIIRSPDEYERKAHYIINNPTKLEPQHYTLGIHVEEASRLFKN